MTIFANLATNYWRTGLPAIPLKRASKIPIFKNWQTFAGKLPDAVEMATWLVSYPNHNIGLPLGPQSGIFVLDIDTVDMDLIQRIEAILPPSPWRRIGAKGCALAFRWHDDLQNFKITDANGKMAVEGLGKGNQIVLPGSIHPDTGQPYTSNYNLWEVVEQLPFLPADIKRQLTDIINPNHTKPRHESDAVHEGGRHAALTSQAGRLFNAGLQGEELKCALQQWNLTNCVPPQDEADIDRIVASAGCDWESDHPLLTTDMGNGERLANRLRGRACFVAEAKDWYFFDGKHWKADPGNLVTREAKAVAQEIYKEAVMRTDNLKGAIRPQSAAAIRNMIELAKSEDGMLRSINEFDLDRHGLNTPSGIVDLKTSSLRPHDPDALFMQITETRYDPQAERPNFSTFLNQIIPCDKEREFVQRFIGYCLTGLGSEQKFLIASGAGANGKSTLLNAVMKMMGDYAKSTPMSTFLSRASGSATNDLASLKGTRLVLANEGNRGQRLDTALLKRMVGGDTIDSRFLHKEFFSYVPTYKPILVSNHLPEIDPTDPAIWRRIFVLPFRESFIGSEDHGLSDKLEAELPGILRWAVEGAALWYEQGLSVPASIVEATEAYRSEIDVIGSFISQHCIEGPQFEVGSTVLYLAFCNYCREMNVEVMTQTLFGRELSRRHYPDKKNNKMIRLNLALKPMGDTVAT